MANVKILPESLNSLTSLNPMVVIVITVMYKPSRKRPSLDEVISARSNDDNNCYTDESFQEVNKDDPKSEPQFQEGSQDVDASEVPVTFIAIKTVSDQEPVFDLKSAIIELNMPLSSDRFVDKSSYLREIVALVLPIVYGIR